MLTNDLPVILAEKAYHKLGKADFYPERVNFRSTFKPKRVNFMLMRTEFRLKKSDLRPDRSDSRLEMANFNPDRLTGIMSCAAYDGKSPRTSDAGSQYRCGRLGRGIQPPSIP